MKSNGSMIGIITICHDLKMWDFMHDVCHEHEIFSQYVMYMI